MAHFAELNENNIVLRVVVVDDDYEADGENWCNNFFGGTWKQTSYNETIRKNYAGIGFIYDETRDAFIPISPFNSWVLNEDTCKWQSPIPYPDDDKNYTWNEDIINWASVTE